MSKQRWEICFLLGEGAYVREENRSSGWSKKPRSQRREESPLRADGFITGRADVANQSTSTNTNVQQTSWVFFLILS